MADTDRAAGAPAQAYPSWFTPLRLLLVFCITNMTVYLDRGVVASNGVNGSPRTEKQPQGSGIQGEFGLSNFEDGLLATAFLVGLLIASPVFSESCKHTSAFRLLGIGMATWVVAAAGCGLAGSFATLLLCRCLVGVGEASFVALAAPFIDDYAPPEHKARWFATFYLCIPVGFAAGYIYGGLVAASLGWRAAFLIEAAAMVPFVVFAFVSQPLHLHGSHDAGPDPSRPRSPKDAVSELVRDAARVASHPVWLATAIAQTLYTAVLGVYAFWGPKAGRRIFGLQGESADLVFGGVTVVTGIVGSLGGGLLLDYIGSTLSNANRLCAFSCLAGCVLVQLAFLAARTFSAFIVLFALGELALFLIQAPVGGLGMWSVPPALRPLAISMTTVAIHMGGDVPSPPLVGALESALEVGKSPEAADQQWRFSMAIISLLLLLAGAVFLGNVRLSERAVDYRKVEALAAGGEEEGEGQGGARRRSSGGSSSGGGGGGDRTPLLTGGDADSAGQRLAAAEEGGSVQHVA